MDYKAPLTRGSHVGSPPGSVMVVDEGMPCGTTIAIWAGLLLGALGTGFGAAGYAFSMENKDKIAEMHAPPPPAPASLNLGNLACAEQIFGGANTPKGTLYPDSPGADFTVYYAPASGTTTASQVPSTSSTLKVAAATPIIQMGASMNPLANQYSFNVPAQTFTAAASTDPFVYTICTTPPCTATNAIATSGSYSATGVQAGSGTGRLAWVVTNEATSTRRVISGFSSTSAQGTVTELATVLVAYSVSFTPADSLSNGHVGNFQTMKLVVEHKVYVTAKAIAGTMHVLVDYVPSNDISEITAYNGATLVTGVESDDEYGIGQTNMEALKLAFASQLQGFYYTHTVNAQCASV